MFDYVKDINRCTKNIWFLMSYPCLNGGHFLLHEEKKNWKSYNDQLVAVRGQQASTNYKIVTNVEWKILSMIHRMSKLKLVE